MAPAQIDPVQLMETMKSQLEALFEEKRAVDRRSREIQVQISGLQQTVKGLVVYAEAQSEQSEQIRELAEALKKLAANTIATTLTEACREVLRSRSQTWMKPTEIRDELEKRGFDFSGYTSNPLSSIHTTLRRLKLGPDKLAENSQGGFLLPRKK